MYTLFTKRDSVTVHFVLFAAAAATTTALPELSKLLTNFASTIRALEMLTKNEKKISFFHSIVQFMIFNGVECFAYLITIFNSRWRLTPRLRQRDIELLIRSVYTIHTYCMSCVAKRCSNILRCMEFSVANEIIFIWWVCTE